MSQFQRWVNSARTANQDIRIALKADAKTPYKTVKLVMSELQDMDESHYYMISQLDAGKSAGAGEYIREVTTKGGR